MRTSVQSTTSLITRLPCSNFRSLAGLEPLTIALRRITMVDYDQHHYDKEVLMKTAVDFGAVVVNPISDLENVRGQINKHLLERGGEAARLSADWCFVDSECFLDYKSIAIGIIIVGMKNTKERCSGQSQ